MKVKSKNYLTIQGWMRTDLNLSGNDLLVYAIIYSYSQDEESYFSGSLQYLADWCGATKQGISKNLKNLMERNLITKEDIAGVPIYYAKPLNIVEQTIKHSLTPVKHSLTNNKVNTKEDNKKVLSKDNTSEFLGSAKKPRKESMYNKCIALINDFTDDAILQEYLTQFFKNCLENSKESGTPFYTNTFKGKLNKLKALSEDNYEQRKIVLQTLDNGWNGFYELKSNKKTNKQVSSDMGYETHQGSKEKLRRSITDGTAESF